MENWRKLSHIYVVCKTFTQSTKGLTDKYYNLITEVRWLPYA